MVGGARIGSGRKKNAHKTKSITFHIRLEWENEVRKLIKEFKFKKNENIQRKLS